MTKSTTTYWDALSPENRERWTAIKGMEGMAEEMTLSVDDVTGEYTRLTRILPGANTAAFGGKTHPFLKKFSSSVVASTTRRLTCGLTPGILRVGPPGEVHGPFKTDVGCVVLEVSFPNRIGDSNATQPIISTDAAR